MSLPLRIFTTSLWGVGDFLSSLMGYPPRRTNVVRNPLGDVRTFCSEFESRYGTDHPPFFMGSYAQALEEAKKELKFLMVYLHSEDHQDTDGFCRGTLCHPRVVEYMRNNMLLWACSVRLPEGGRVSEALRECGYPFLAVIVLRQSRMVVEALLEWLEVTVREYEAFIVAARAERDERNFNREIRSEQEAAFAETLRQDQEKEQERRRLEQEREEEAARLRAEEEEERRKAEEEAERKAKIRRMKIDLVDNIPDEPEPSCPDAIRILIKLPGGQRLERR